MRQMAYKRATDWTSAEIREGENGWIIEMDSAIQGDVTGRVVRIPYSEDLPRGCDLSQPWNDYMDKGSYMIDFHEVLLDRFIRKGHKVN